MIFMLVLPVRYTTCLFLQAKWYPVSLQVGDRDDSNLYISMKLKAAAEVKWFVSGNFFYKVYLQQPYIQC